MPADRPDARASPLLLLVVLTALGVGAAASIIVAAHASAPFVPPATPEVYVSEGVVVLFLILLFGGMTWALIHQRAGSPTGSPARLFAPVLVAILLLILFVVLYRFIHNAVSPGGTGNGTVPGNGTTNPPPPPPGPSLGGGGGTFEFLHLPSWTLFALLAVFAVVVVVVVVPRVRIYLAERGRDRPEDVSGERARTALARAAQRLAAGQNARAVILDLYSGLLERVRPVTGNLDPSTPEEIRYLHLLRLGIRTEPAAELTRLFEEARYSTHPLGPEAAERASRAIAAAKEDLARTPLAS